MTTPRSKRQHLTVLIILLTPFGMAAGVGCVELAALFLGSEFSPDENGDGFPPGNDNGNDNGDPGTGVPVVQLQVSNTSPVVGEEVMFTCVQTAGAMENVTFDFITSETRLVEDGASGTARLIIDQTDVATSISVQCVTTNAFGTSEPSNTQTIIPLEGTTPPAPPSEP